MTAVRRNLPGAFTARPAYAMLIGPTATSALFRCHGADPTPTGLSNLSNAASQTTTARRSLKPEGCLPLVDEAGDVRPRLNVGPAA